MSRFDESSFRFRFRFDDFALFHRLGMGLGIADIVDGIFDVVRGLVGADGLDDLRRDTYRHRAVRDDHSFRHQRPRASQLGCTTTHFSCPHGLYDANNYSTARDLAKIALACYANPTYRQVADTVLYQLPATNVHETRTITTTNKLLQPGSAAYRSYAHGMKTGFTTKAGRCFVTFAQQDGHTYGLVILGSNSQNIFREASELLDWAFTSPELHPVQTTTQPEAAAPAQPEKPLTFWQLLFS